MVRQWVKDREASGRPLVGPRRHVVILIFGLTVMILVSLMYDRRMTGPDALDHVVEVKAPAALSGAAQAGRVTFIENCAACHGTEAQGTAQGPPLIHRYYAPDHHADGAFYLAVSAGVTAHHWDFGDMPPQPQIHMNEVSNLVDYVRELQQANGIR